MARLAWMLAIVVQVADDAFGVNLEDACYFTLYFKTRHVSGISLLSTYVAG